LRLHALSTFTGCFGKAGLDNDGLKTRLICCYAKESPFHSMLSTIPRPVVKPGALHFAEVCAATGGVTFLFGYGLSLAPGPGPFIRHRPVYYRKQRQRWRREALFLPELLQPENECIYSGFNISHLNRTFYCLQDGRNRISSIRRILRKSPHTFSSSNLIAPPVRENGGNLS